MTEKPRQPELLALVARMVCAQAATGAVDFEALPETIRSVTRRWPVLETRPRPPRRSNRHQRCL